MKLIIGNKNYSSWSLRPWLLLSQNNIEFEEIRIPLNQKNTYTEFAKYTKAAKVPVLHDTGIIVWDSLAICEYISEQYLNGKGWPEKAGTRAEARSCCAEMHSGFFTIRNLLPMNCRAQNRKVEMTDALNKEIQRVDSLWSEMRQKYGQYGKWLFGEFSIADSMFAPVVFRFSTYGINVSKETKAYMVTVLANKNIQLWSKQASQETEIIESEEVGV